MDNSLAFYWRLWSSFLGYTSLQQHCMKVVVDNNLRYARLTNHFCIYFCMVITTSYCYIIISASLFFFNLNFNFFINLFRLQWCKHVCPSILLKRILIFKFIMSSLSIKMSRSPQQNVTFMHWNHVTQNLINILLNWKRNQNLLSHFHLTTIIQQLQPLRSIMLNCTQIPWSNYINSTSIIYNQTIHLVLYMAMCMEDVLLLTISSTLAETNYLSASSLPKLISITHECKVMVIIMYICAFIKVIFNI
jgi:hypothetical protein